MQKQTNRINQAYSLCDTVINRQVRKTIKDPKKFTQSPTPNSRLPKSSGLPRGSLDTRTPTKTPVKGFYTTAAGHSPPSSKSKLFFRTIPQTITNTGTLLMATHSWHLALSKCHSPSLQVAKYRMSTPRVAAPVTVSCLFTANFEMQSRGAVR